MVKCDFCSSNNMRLKKNVYVCADCGHTQKPKRKQYTFPLDEGIGKYAKRRR